MKITFIILLLAVLAVLGAAGVLMLRSRRSQGQPDRRMAWALALRVALSIGLFLLLLLSWRLGWFQPTGLPIGR